MNLIVPRSDLLDLSSSSVTDTSSCFDILNDGFTGEDLDHPQGYLVYIFFDESLVVDTVFSGVIQVSEPGVLEELQTNQLTMPANGYFFTYLTNYSDQMVTFDNLTIHYVQGVLRAQYDYYPYGLSWGQTESAYNKTYSATEFNYNEWSTQGLDLQHFEARMYDPVLGRWHAPDPLEQFHSPYLAMCDNPANFIDPDGRAGIPWLQDFMESDLGMFCQWAASTAAMVGGVALLENISALGGPMLNAVSFGFGAASVTGTALSIKDIPQIAEQGLNNILPPQTAESINFEGTGRNADVQSTANNANYCRENSSIMQAPETIFTPLELGPSSSIDPPMTQEEFDQRYFTDFERFERELRDVVSNFIIDNSLTGPISQDQLIEVISPTLRGDEMILSEVDQTTGEKISGNEYHVVDIESYSFMQGVSSGSPYSVIPGTSRTVPIFDSAYRPDSPRFIQPSKYNSSIIERWIRFYYYDPNNGYRYSGQAIRLVFQLIIKG